MKPHVSISGKTCNWRWVIAIVSCQLSLVTIGLKLPLHLDVASLVSQAKQEADVAGESPQSLENSLDIRALIIKKMERQLFVFIDIKQRKVLDILLSTFDFSRVVSCSRSCIRFRLSRASPASLLSITEINPLRFWLYSKSVQSMYQYQATSLMCFC